jgi:predicted ferric reductase
MDFVKKYQGAVVLFLVSSVPLFLWLQYAGFSTVTTDNATLVTSLGKAVALSGIALYSVMPVLSMRHRAIAKLFGGTGRVYSLHKTAGKMSFFLILLHPVLLGGGRMMGGLSIASVWDWWSLSIIIGAIGLCGLVFVTGMSIYSHIKHQNWIIIHRLFGWLLPLFFVHALVARGQIVQNKTLFIYMLAIGLLGFGAFAYRSIFSRFIVKQHRYVVAEVNRFTGTVTEIVLKPLGVPIVYAPGQFAFLRFEAEGIDSEAHPYSFSNANNGPYARFTVKALGDDTAALQNLECGTKAFLEGPYGDFSYRNLSNRKQVWIAGGVGITPFLSMARSLAGSNKYDIRFFYGTESLEDAVFLGEFLDITRHLPDNFNTKVVSKDIEGFVTLDLLKESLGNLGDFDYMICGPQVMMRMLEEQLLSAGVQPRQIHIEAFSM